MPARFSSAAQHGAAQLPVLPRLQRGRQGFHFLLRLGKERDGETEKEREGKRKRERERS